MIVFSQKSCSSAAGNPHIFLPQFQLKLHQQQQLRHLHRILNRNPPFVASKEAQGGGHYFPLPACPPISAAISIESSSASSPSSSSFRLANVPVPTPQFPMSNGLGPTPSPATWNPTSKSSSCRRVGLIGRKMGMTSFWDEWGRIRPVTILQVRGGHTVSEMVSTFN